MELVPAIGAKSLSNVGEIYRPSFGCRLVRPLISMRIPAGFPSPAEGYVESRLDLNARLVKHPMATFYVRVIGDSMQGAGFTTGICSWSTAPWPPWTATSLSGSHEKVMLRG